MGRGRLSDCYAAAIANAQVRFAVNLSSIGAQHAKGTGLIVGLHNQERELDGVAGLNVLHPRATVFYGESVHEHGALA